VLASLGLASVTLGAWINRYRPIFVVITMSLLGLSFYRVYSGKGNISPLSKRVLWITALISLALTAYSIRQSLRGL